jgi:hypothetical protein
MKPLGPFDAHLHGPWYKHQKYDNHNSGPFTAKPDDFTFLKNLRDFVKEKICDIERFLFAGFILKVENSKKEAQKVRRTPGPGLRINISKKFSPTIKITQMCGHNNIMIECPHEGKNKRCDH